MHHIQDKNLDQLFKDKLGNAEIEPSANLWDSIHEQLEPAKKRRFSLYWMAAAAILVVVSAGVLFNKQEKIRLHGPASVAVNQRSILKDKPAKGVKPAVVEPEKTSTTLVADVKSFSDVRLVSGKEVGNVLNMNSISSIEKKEVIAMQPKGPDAHLILKDPIKPDVLLQITKLPEELMVAASNEIPVIIPDEVINENTEAIKKGIRNVGDLVNYVVNKVDKREEKLLKFDTDDDDNSSLVAINIGFIKFNTRKHK